jgi:adenosine deaminase
VLLQEQDFYDMTAAYLRRAAADNVRHAEIFFDPQTYTARGVSMATVINGIHRACQDSDISATLILASWATCPKRTRWPRWTPRCRTASSSSASA